MDRSRIDSISRLFAERRLTRRQAMQRGAGALAAGTLATAGLAHVASAQEATPTASPVAGAETEKVSFLFVQSFGAGSIATGDDGKLTLTADHLTGQTVYFSDRPERIVGTVNTERFLGLDRAASASATPGAASATPGADGIGFSPADPPNAALVFNSAAGSDEPGDVLVVELINPTYDPASGHATYELNVLADENVVDMTLVSEPVTSADAIRSFDGASLFIDDCPDGAVGCYNVLDEPVGVIYGQGFCWNWAHACCAPCFQDDLRAQCTATYGGLCEDDGCEIGWTGSVDFGCPSPY